MAVANIRDEMHRKCLPQGSRSVTKFLQRPRVTARSHRPDGSESG